MIKHIDDFRPIVTQIFKYEIITSNNDYLKGNI